MTHNIIVTGAGSGGAENLIRSLRNGSLDLRIYGSNMDSFLLAKSSADVRISLPGCNEEGYIDNLNRIIDKENIELIIPNNDSEVGKISQERNKLSCNIFLPSNETVQVCQDKLQLHNALEKSNIHQARSLGIKSLVDIDHFMKTNPGERYWIRPRRGSGSMGATWVKNSKQAANWIELWVDLRGMKITDFMVSEFLPGRDYAFQSVWKDGKLLVAKLVERLSYIMARNRLSNMSSSPATARTLRDENALETIFKAIKSVSEIPNGNYNLDLKGRADGIMCVTEFNIGRFCMITPIFDNTGKYNTAEIHVKAALDMAVDIYDPIDIEEDVYLLRELDTLPTILRRSEFDKIIDDSNKWSSN